MAKILIKRSSVPGYIPGTGDLSIGELQLNTADGKLFMKKSILAVETIIEVGKEASTAIKLSTGRKINGVLFDGSHDISFGTNSVVEESNFYFTQARFDASFNGKSTSNLFEGNNLYFTNARAAAAAPVQTVSGRAGNITLSVADITNALNKTGDTMTGYLVLNANPTTSMHATTKQYVDSQISGGNANTANQLTTARRINGVLFDGTQDISFGTSNVSEGSNLYYTQARFDAAFASKSTSNLVEGSNLYFTNARASAAAPVQSVFGRTGNVVMNANDVVAALGYTPTNSSGVGTPGGTATLDANGKLLASQVPAIAISDTFVVSSQAAQLALVDADIGDIAVRTDISKSFILKATGYSNLANWQELLTPVDVVQSVNGQTGVVTLTTSNISEGSNLYFTNGRAAAAAPVQSVNGKTGAVVLSATELGGIVPIANGGTGSDVAETAAANLGVSRINPANPKDGDIKVTAGPIISIYATGAWRQIFPAVYV